MNTQPCIGFRSGRPRLSWAAPFHSGSFIGLAIAERRDREKTKRHATAPRPVSLPAPVVEAQAWAARVGFSADEVPKAAVCALFLRRIYGKGNVSVDQVRRQIRGSA